MSKTDSPQSKVCRQAVLDGVREAVQAWLPKAKDRHVMYRFDVDGVGCVLEFFTGHWKGVSPYGMAEGGRWWWGRLDAGDPDEDELEEDVLLDVALGCPLSRGRPIKPKRKKLSMPFGEQAHTAEETRALAAAWAKQNLGKIVLHQMAID